MPINGIQLVNSEWHSVLPVLNKILSNFILIFEMFVGIGLICNGLHRLYIYIQYDIELDHS